MEAQKFKFSICLELSKELQRVRDEGDRSLVQQRYNKPRP